MYEELVEALRLCGKYGLAQDALANAERAADVIEELQRQIDAEEAGVLFPSIVTNADRIRAMTDKELAELFAPTDNGLKPCPKGAKYPKSCEHGCGNCWLDWLTQEAEDGT